MRPMNTGLVLLFLAVEIIADQNITFANGRQSNSSAADVTSELQHFSQEEVLQSHTLCDICFCPEDWNQQPYIINCKALLLKEIPAWSDRLTAEDTAVDTVHLELDYNSFEIVSLIKACPVIDGISFGSNQIVGIEPFAFAELPNLKRLCLSGNQIELIHPSAFKMSDGQCSSIEVLDLSNNNLYHLDSEIFENMANLVELNLGRNPFGSLDPYTVFTLNAMPALRYLNVADTGLSDLPLTLADALQSLERLNIAHNHFEEVPEVLQHGHHLLELIMSNNPLTELQASSFIELQSLQVLYINNMPALKTIYKGTFYPLMSLRTLKCNNNPNLEMIEIGSFWNEYREGPVDLVKLELRGNNLTTFKKELFGDLEIQHLDIRNNPLNCSCQVAWLKTAKAAWDYLNETNCWFPAEFNGKSIADVDLICSEKISNLAINEKKHNAPFNFLNYFFASIFLICLVLLVAILILFMRLKRSAQYKNLTSISETKSNYKESNSGRSSNVQYMRQFDEDI